MKEHAFSPAAGQSFTEYTLLLAAIAASLIGILLILGIDVQNAYCRVVGLFDKNSPCGSDLLFSDDFSHGLDQWDIWMGDSWDNTDGEHLCKTGTGEHRIMANGTDADNYTVETDAALLSGNGYGIAFRATNDPAFNGYTFQYDPGYNGGQFIMRKWVDGYELWPPFAAAPAPAGFNWRDVQRHITVDVQGDTFIASVDGQTVLTGQDDSYKTGAAGLRAWEPSAACFDNFVVTSH